jgi:hypothetical protein
VKGRGEVKERGRVKGGAGHVGEGNEGKRRCWGGGREQESYGMGMRVKGDVGGEGAGKLWEGNEGKRRCGGGG